jgi:copper(I)-binding protein
MKICISLITLTTALLFTINNPSQANGQTISREVGDLIISNIWARVTPEKAKTGAAFFTIKNKSKFDDALIGVSSEIAKKTAIHQSFVENDITKMRHVRTVELPAGGVTELKSGSFHIMFIGLYAPIKEGNVFPLTLTFKTAKNINVMVKASKSTTKSPANHSKMQMR